MRGRERGQIKREYNEQLYSYGVMVCLSYLRLFFFSLNFLGININHWID